MIVSHAHRFIFLKTRKTAGTSIEMALRPLLGPDDISTPFLPEEEASYDGPPPRNYRLGDSPPVLRNLVRRVRGRPPKWRELYDHISAPMVRRHVGEAVWASYFKFAFERNPWDRQVSFYFFVKGRRGWDDLSFEQFMRMKKARVRNTEIYATGNELAVDAIGRYETLAEDFARFVAALKLGDLPALPTAKADFRRGEGYRAFYSEETRDQVARWYRREIDWFGYTF